MKMYLAAFLILAPLLCANVSARESNTSIKTAPVTFVAKSLPDDESLLWGWSYATWKFPDKNILTARYQCEVEKFLDFWPYLKSCEGTFLSSVSDDRPENIFLNQRSVSHPELYQEVLLSEPLLKFNDKQYELARFQEITANAIATYEDRVKSNIQQERFITVLVLGLIFLAVWYSVVFILKIAPIVKRILSGVDKKIIDIPKKVKILHDQHVFRSAVIDESARELTRKTFKDADERSQVVIQKAIIQALENGDKELAEALKSSLKK